MIVLASPVYYHGFTGQLQCAISRIYALDKPKYLKKAALLLSSGSDHIYCGCFYEYQNSFKINRLRSWKNYIDLGKVWSKFKIELKIFF